VKLKHQRAEQCRKFTKSAAAVVAKSRERCSLWDDFSSTVAIADVYKLRYSEVVTIKRLVLRIKSPTKRIFRNLHMLKINRITLFCTLFIYIYNFFRTYLWNDPRIL